MTSKFWFKLSSTLIVLSMALAATYMPQSAKAQTTTGVMAGSIPVSQLSMPSQADLANFPARADGSIDLMLEMTAAPTGSVYVQNRAQGNAAQASLDAKAQFQQIDAAQKTLVNALNALKIGAAVLYRSHAAYNGVAINVSRKHVADLASLPGVKAIHVLIPKTVDNSTTVPLINAPYAWQYGTSYRGTGIKIGVIDTGIDYLHADFGGPGTQAAYTANDTTIAGDVPNYPGVKVAGGYDFAGDAYNADTVVVPTPDPDPMDCYGHGSHVAGTIAGYGENADGSTYTGSYGEGTDFNDLYIGPGVAPDATLYALRVFGCSGSTDLVTGAIDWAADPNGDGDPSDHLDVINMSLGSPFGTDYDVDADASDLASQVGVIVVAAAGNSYDTQYDVGSPSTATSAISVAASIDPVDTMDGFEVVNSGAANDVYGSSNSINGWSGSPVAVPVTAPLVFPNIAGNTGGCQAFAAGSLTGDIVLLDWTYTFAPSDTSECGSGARVKNAGNAGAVGVIFANTKPYLDITISGNAIAPSTITTLATGNILKAKLAAGAVTVMLTKAHNGSIKNVDPTINDSLASFSARGPRRLDNFLKPDITAPGMTVFSVYALTGDGGESMSGTSMATPHMTGVMALLRQLHPSWTVEELKALAMNTATHNLYTVGAGVGDQYAGPRVGAGRVDVENAVLDNVIAYNAEDSGAVSVSFGSVEVPVDGQASLKKAFFVANKNGELSYPLTFDVAYVPSPSLDTTGVAFTVEDDAGNAVSQITLNPGETQKLYVHMTANGAVMKHTLDKTMYSLQGDTLAAPNNVSPRYWMSEVGGQVTLTPPATGAASQVETVRMPVYAVTRPVSNMQGDATIALPGASGTAQVNLTGTGINTGSNYPTDVASLVTALELKAVSPKNDLLDSPFSTGDFQYVGIMSDRNHEASMDSTVVTFGFSTYGNWTTPNGYYGDTYYIWIDTNMDNKADALITNSALTADANSNPTDVFRSYVYFGSTDNQGNFTPTEAGWSGYLNGIMPSIYDSAVYNTNVMTMSIPALWLGLTDKNSRFNFWLESNSAEWPLSTPIDTVGSAAQPLSYDAYNLAIDTTAGLAPNPTSLVLPPAYPDIQAGSPLCASGTPFVLSTCGTIPFTYNKANAPEGGILGLLLLHHQNGDGNRAQAITLETKQIYLPVISTP